MAAPSGRDRASLSELLFERPSRFQFFQAVRLLRKLRPERAGVGRDDPPANELVRFRSDLSYAFPTGDVRSLERGDATAEGEGEGTESQEVAGPDEMVVNFLGIATPNSFGSLPTAYLEEIRAQEREKNRAMRDFLDLFNHRLVSLFYRAWEYSRPDVLFELNERSPFESALRAAIGIEGEAQARRLPFDNRDILARAGLISMRPAPASAIQSLVESLCGVPAQVQQFLPCWYEMDDDDRTRLGSANSVLGETACLGAEVCLSQWRFRVRLGPMDLATYRSLLPETDAFHMLSSVVRLATGPEYGFEFTLVLDRSEVPPLRLRGTEPEGEPTRLGWSTWLGQENRSRDPDDAVFTPSLIREEEHDSMEMDS